MKKVLILGGTRFIGRHLVERLMKDGRYSLTLFNRGKTESQLFPEIGRLTGDRETEAIRQIGEYQWDAVIDLSCYYPAALRSALDALKDRCGHYIFMSTVSVYDMEQPSEVPDRPESAALLSCSAAEAVDRGWGTYGKKKAECERILSGSGQSYVSLRPSIVYGAYDYTDRFYYWLYQVEKELPLLLPEGGKRTLAMTYISDLVEAIAVCLDDPGLQGSFNIISGNDIGIGNVVRCAEELLSHTCEYFDAPYAFLEEQKVHQGTDLPLWIHGDHFTFSAKRMAEELQIQPVAFEDTVRETIAWCERVDWPQPSAGMSEERKNNLLKRLLSSP